MVATAPPATDIVAPRYPVARAVRRGTCPGIAPCTRRCARRIQERSQFVSAPFFDNVDRIVHEGPDTDNPLAFRYYDKDREGARQADGGPPAARRLLLALVQRSRRGHVRRRDAGSPLARRDQQPRSVRAQAGRGLRVLREARRAVLLLSRSRHRPRRRHPGGEQRHRLAHCGPDGGADGGHGDPAAVGVPPTCSATPAMRPAQPPTRTRRSSPTRRPR